MSLMDSLGLDDVEADPNFLEDGPYEGEVYKSEYVITDEKKNGNKTGRQLVSHVITYRVVDGPRKGAQKPEWFRLGVDPQYSDDASHRLVGMTPTMTETAKPWYKKRFVDLGIPEERVASTKPEDLIGIQCRFGIKTKDGFKNVSFVEAKAGTATQQAVPNPSASQHVTGEL